MGTNTKEYASLVRNRQIKDQINRRNRSPTLVLAKDLPTPAQMNLMAEMIEDEEIPEGFREWLASRCRDMSRLDAVKAIKWVLAIKRQSEQE